MPFVILKGTSDASTLVVTAVLALLIVVSQWIIVRRRSQHESAEDADRH